MLADLSIWWLLGGIIGAVVVVVAAALLVTIILLARRIVAQARDITAALEGARDNTVPLFDVSALNLSLDRTVRALHEQREGRQ